MIIDIKKTVIYIFVTSLYSISYAQVGINTDNSAPHASSILDVKSNTKAFYPPRMSSVSKNNILGVQAGAVVYDTDLNALSFYNGSSWISAEKSANEFTTKSYLYSEVNKDATLLNNGFVQLGYTINDYQLSSNINAPVQSFIETSSFLLSRTNLKIISIPNNKFVVWGGQESGVYLSNGAIYDAINDSWESIPDMGDGVIRTNPAVVWINNRLLVWGGGTNITSGKIYNPITRQWSIMNQINVPSWRTGYAFGFNMASNEFILWGGQDASSFFANGAKYDVINNIWTPITGTGTPAERARMGFGVNNGKMFIFGGFNASSSFNDAYFYDFATNVWSAVPASGLTAKFNNIYYTGTSYIVYGPGSGSNEGAIFNTITNTWTPMSVVGAPSVFKDLFVYSNGYFVAPNGAAYQLNSNTWAAFPIITNFNSADFAGNDTCLFSFGGLAASGNKAANVVGGNRFFWAATPIIKHENKIIQLYIYRKN